MWEARDLICAGARWIIGSGDSIDIVGQPWLNDEANHFVTTISESFKNNKVSSLFAINSTNWDTNIVRDLFNERD